MIDPLNADIQLAGVDTSLPVLPAAEYVCQIKESVIVPNAAKTGFNWKLVFGLASPATALDGREVKVDFPIITNAALQPKPDTTDQDGFKRQLGQLIDGIFGSTKDNRPNFNKALVDGVVGRMVKVTTKVGDYNGEPKTEFVRVKKAE